MNILIFGAGYVGCVSAACLAKMGHTVKLFDVIPAKIDAIRNGHSPILEPGLDSLIAEGVESGRLKAELASPSGRADVIQADVAMVCIATPSLTTGVIDTRALRRVFEAIARGASLRRSALTVIVRSTVLAPMLRQILLETQPQSGVEKLSLVINPELLRETTAIADFFRPPMLVAGGDNGEAVDQALSLYDGIEAPRYKVTLETASVLKYSCNAFHALKIAFANEIDTVAALIGANGQEVMQLLVQDKVLNISPAYLRPGFAFGGSCLPKDLRALEALARENHESVPLLSSILPSNRRRIDQALDAIVSRPARRLGVIGLTFKRGSDDLRESPYVELTERLLGKGFEVKVYDSDLDPKRLMGANRTQVLDRLPHLTRILSDSLESACEDVEAIVLCKPLVEFEQLRASIDDHVVIYDLERMTSSTGSKVSPPEHLRHTATSTLYA